MRLIYQPIYWTYRTVSSVWYWAQRRFTTAGLCVFGGFLVAGATGLDVESTVTYQSFAALLGLLLIAFAGGWKFRAQFAAVRLLPRLGTAGQRLQYRVRVRNLGQSVYRGLTLLEDPADPRPPYAQWLEYQLAESRRVRPFRVAQRHRTHPFRRVKLKEAEVPPMLALGEVDVTMNLVPLRRGILRFSGVTLARTDVFGLFRAFARVSVPQTVLILPRRYPVPPLALPGVLKYQEGGVALAANVGSSDEFVSLRDYRPGDPLRHIHWRSWARSGRPIVKEFEDEFFVRHALILDTFTTEPQSERLEEAVSVAASFACTVLTQESLLDLLFVGPQSYRFTAGRGLAHADQMLEVLAAVGACPSRPFETLEHLVLNYVSLVSGCICVLLAWDEPRQQMVKKLRQLDVPTLVLVIVPPGTRLEPGVMQDEPGRFHVLEIGKIEAQLAKLK